MCELRLGREKPAREVVSSFRSRRSFLLVAIAQTSTVTSQTSALTAQMFNLTLTEPRCLPYHATLLHELPSILVKQSKELFDTLLKAPEVSTHLHHEIDGGGRMLIDQLLGNVTDVQMVGANKPECQRVFHSLFALAKFLAKRFKLVVGVHGGEVAVTVEAEVVLGLQKMDCTTIDEGRQGGYVRGATE
jgi:hypothetical protein